MFTKEHAEINKKYVGKKYRPSNGTEGEMFMAKWCCNCGKDNPDKEDFCPIIDDAMALNADDKNYPQSWQYGKDGQPKCTAFEANK